MAVKTVLQEIKHFIIHLRIIYQLVLLSGGYLLAGLFVQEIDLKLFVTYFLWWHLGLYSGATAYNSYWDKDEGPIGGIHKPPPMKPWMWGASWLWMISPLPVLFIEYNSGSLPVATFIIYGTSIFLFWAYSSPILRWKGHPYLSVFVIAISTGTNGFLMGYLAAGGDLGATNFLGATNYMASVLPYIGASGVALILISLYPISQLFQMDEDQRRNDRTLAMHIGLNGVRRYYLWTYVVGVILVATALMYIHGIFGALFLVGAAVGGALTYRWLLTIKGEPSEYSKVMLIKYISSASFLSYILLMGIYVHIL